MSTLQHCELEKLKIKSSVWKIKELTEYRICNMILMFTLMKDRYLGIISSKSSVMNTRFTYILILSTALPVIIHKVRWCIIMRGCRWKVVKETNEISEYQTIRINCLTDCCLTCYVQKQDLRQSEKTSELEKNIQSALVITNERRLFVFEVQILE